MTIGPSLVDLNQSGEAVVRKKFSRLLLPAQLRRTVILPFARDPVAAKAFLLLT